jgi:hypothetical protein
MSKNLKTLTDYLLRQGIDQVEHTNKTYLAHLIGVYRDLETWGCTEEVCRAGMFHSIYGTEMFQGFKLPLERRADVRQIIGERAERLAYLNCAMDRASFDRAATQQNGPYRITDRLTRQEVELSPDDLNDLCRVHLCDWLEQVPRSRKWDYRPQAYRQLAQRLGGPAKQAYDQVFAQAAAANV